MFACSKNQETLTISDEGFEYSYVKLFSRCILYWPAFEGVSVYQLVVYPTGDTTKCLCDAEIIQDDTTITNSFMLLDDVCSWQYLDIYLTGYNADRTVKSNTIKKTIVCSVEEDDIYMAEEQEAGVVPGYEESVEYYYVMLSENINIVKPATTKQYAIIVDDIQNVDSIRLPINYDGAYTLNTDLKAIVVDPAIVNAYSIGAVFPMFVTYKNGDVKEYDISIVKALCPIIEPITTSRGTNSLTITCLSGNSNWTIENVIVDNKKTSAYKTSGDTDVVFDSKGLASLSNGDHNLKIYYSYQNENVGYSETTLTIDRGDKAPYNVNLSFDNTYPSVKVTWDADWDYDYAEVHINSSVLSTKNQPELFVGKSITLTNYITKTSDAVYVKLVYANGEEYSSKNVYLDSNLSSFVGSESYFTTKVQYLDRTVNKFITSQDELNDFIAYHVIHFGDSDNWRSTQCNVTETYTICSPHFANTTTAATFAKKVKAALDVFIEPLYYDISNVSISGDKITFSLSLYSGSTRSYNSYHEYEGTSDYTEYAYSELHYYKNGDSQRSSSFDDFKYKQNATTVTVSTSLELELALEQGFNVKAVSGSNAETILNEAKSVLRQIVDDRMTDYEKVLAMYDWLTYNIIYDRGLTSYIDSVTKFGSAYNSVYKNSSFYADGVFLYHIAVCNGIGAAYSIMANMEGIPAYKVMGKVYTNSSHTWVKVFVNDEWYICDPTWGGAKDVDGGNLKEFISYDFFMMDESEAYSYENRREFDDKDAYTVYAGNTAFDYFASSSFVYDGKVYTKYITSTQEFDALMNYYTQKLNTGEEIQISIKMPKTDTNYSNSAQILYKWLTEIYYVQHPTTTGAYNIKVYARCGGDLVDVGDSSDTGLVIEKFNDVVYIRIKAL